jgi:hypothetical protein
VIKSVKDRFNVSIAEVGLQNAYQSAVIGVVSVSGDQHHLNKVLSHVSSVCREDTFGRIG